jgi:hypothetical protein
MQSARIAVSLTLVLLLAPAVPALAGEGDFRAALRKYQWELKNVSAAEKNFWKESSKRLRHAYDLFRSQWVEWYGKPDAPPDIFYDLTGYRKLYAEYESFGRRKGEAACALGKVDGEKAAKALFKQMLVVNAQIAKIEKKLKSARAVADVYHYDQEPPIRRLGLEQEFLGLVKALGMIRDEAALGWLAEKGWKEACGADKRSRGIQSRVALLDALAQTSSAGALALLREACLEKDLSLRIAALEGVARFGTTHADDVQEAALTALASEKTFSIRITALRILKAMKSVRTTGPLIEVLRKEVEDRDGGVICGHILGILKELTGKDYGMNWENWRGWYNKHREAIDKGTFKPGGEKDDGGAGKKKMKTVSFYNIPTYSKGIIIIIDASDTLIIPADIDIAKKHSVFYWLEASRKKLEKYASQLDVLKEEAQKAIGAMDENTLFNVVLLYRDDRIEPCWPKLQRATEVNRKKALKFFQDVRAGGWAPQHDGILEAFKIAGLDPWATNFEGDQADTFYLLTDGGICGGRFMTPSSINEAVKRLNRFRNVTINTVQIADLGPDAVEFLRGLARITGGTYTWRKK